MSRKHRSPNEKIEQETRSDGAEREMDCEREPRGDGAKRERARAKRRWGCERRQKGVVVGKKKRGENSKLNPMMQRVEMRIT